MSYTCIAACSTLLAATSLCQGEVVLIDDFNDNVLDGWNLYLPGLVTAEDGRMQIRTTQAMDAGECYVGYNGSWNAGYFPQDQFADGTFRIQFRPHNSSTLGFIFIRDDPAQGFEGYSFVLDTANQIIGIGTSDLSNCTFPTLASAPFTLLPGVDYQIEGVAIGPNLSLKVWVAGNPEPAEPQLTASDETFFQGSIVIGCALPPGVTAKISGSLDNLEFEPVPPPLPGDLDGNGSVDAADLGQLLAQWGLSCSGCPADIDDNGSVDAADLGLLLGNWTD